MSRSIVAVWLSRAKGLVGTSAAFSSFLPVIAAKSELGLPGAPSLALAAARSLRTLTGESLKRSVMPSYSTPSFSALATSDSALAKSPSLIAARAWRKRSSACLRVSLLPKPN